MTIRERFRTALSEGRFDRARSLLYQLKAAGSEEEAAANKVILATCLHDCAELSTFAASSEAARLRKDPRQHCRFALAMYWTCGLQQAAAELEAACSAESSPPQDRWRQQCCALADLAKLTVDRAKSVITTSDIFSIGFLKGQEIPVIEAAVNRLPPNHFILDTGAATSVITRDYCNRQGIPFLAQSPFTVRDASGNDIQAHSAMVERIEIAGITVRNWTATVFDLSPKLQVAGILSPLDTFRGIPFELDMRQHELRILSRASGDAWSRQAEEPVYSTQLVWNDGNIFVRAFVDGKKAGWFLLDSGALGNCVTIELARSLNVTPVPENVFQSITATSVRQVFQSFVAEITVNAAPAVKSDLFIVDEDPDPDSPALITSSGYLGIPWMSGRRLLFPPDGRSVLFTDSTAMQVL